MILMAGREHRREKGAKKGDPSLFWSHRMWFDGIASCLGGREFILTLDIWYICAECGEEPHQQIFKTLTWTEALPWISRTCNKFMLKQCKVRKQPTHALGREAQHCRPSSQNHAQARKSRQWDMRSSGLRWGWVSTVRPQDQQQPCLCFGFWHLSRRECETDVIHQTFAKHYAELFNQAKSNEIKFNSANWEPLSLLSCRFQSIRQDPKRSN